MDMEIKNVPINFSIKEVSGEGIFGGYASIFDVNPDSYGDIVRKGAFTKSIQEGGRNKNGIPMLYQHRSDYPIGTWPILVEDSFGLKVQGKLTLESSWGKDVYVSMKAGSLKNLSIGFTTNKVLYDEENEVRELIEINLWEISVVTFPAKIGANVSNIKAIESAKNERDLENALRESGLSKNASLYIVKLCRDKLRESISTGNPSELLDAIKNLNNNIKGLR